MSKKQRLPAPLRALVRRLGGSVKVHTTPYMGLFFATVHDCDGHHIIDHPGTHGTEQDAIDALCATVVSAAKSVLRADGWEFSE